jgi:hypothetical protein
MRSKQDAWGQLCDDVDQLRRTDRLSEEQLDQIGCEADRLYCAGRLSDDQLLRLSRALLSPEDFKRIDAIAYGLAKFLHTPLDQLAIESQLSRETTVADAVSSALRGLPGLAGHGVVLQNPHDPPHAQYAMYEVRWLRGYPVPALPPSIDGYPVKLVIVDELPVPQ